MKLEAKAIMIGTIIIAIIIIIWLMVRVSKQTTDGVVRRLRLPRDLSDKLKEQVKIIKEISEEHPTGIHAWSKPQIKAAAKMLRISSAQVVVIHAAYQLTLTGAIDLAEYEKIKKKIISM